MLLDYEFADWKDEVSARFSETLYEPYTSPTRFNRCAFRGRSRIQRSWCRSRRRSGSGSGEGFPLYYLQFNASLAGSSGGRSVDARWTPMGMDAGPRIGELRKNH